MDRKVVLLGSLIRSICISGKVGASAVDVPYFNKSIELSEAFPQGRSAEDYKQRLIGLDFEYGMSYFQFIGEWVFNQWQVPNLTEGHLSSSSGYVEGKYELGHSLYYALRFGRIGYKEIDDG